jgi:hypothetical protein
LRKSIQLDQKNLVRKNERLFQVIRAYPQFDKALEDFNLIWIAARGGIASTANETTKQQRARSKEKALAPCQIEDTLWRILRLAYRRGCGDPAATLKILANNWCQFYLRLEDTGQSG